MSKRILSIDDSRMVHLVVTKTLKPLDVDVVTAVNGQEGIEKAEQTQPDLILLDATMPLMDGIEALGALKANQATKEIPVVMLSDTPDAESSRQARELGAVDSIPKPFTGDSLVAGLSPYLDLSKKAA
jgi:CheY-like chemotaxis protein